MREVCETHRQHKPVRQRVHGGDVRRQRDSVQAPLQAVGYEGGLLQHAQDAVPLHPIKARPCHLRMARASPCTVLFRTGCTPLEAPIWKSLLASLWTWENCNNSQQHVSGLNLMAHPKSDACMPVLRSSLRWVCQQRENDDMKREACRHMHEHVDPAEEVLPAALL